MWFNNSKKEIDSIKNKITRLEVDVDFLLNKTKELLEVNK